MNGRSCPTTTPFWQFALMSKRRRTIRLVLCVAPVTVLALLLLLSCLTPVAVYTFGIEFRPPWQEKAAWHLSRIDWFVQEAGYEHIVHEHRAKLIAMGPDAVPTLIEQAASGYNRHNRERAILLLKEIGHNGRPLVLAAATDAEGDRRGRLLYTLFVAFNDQDAFNQWLEYALLHGAFALQDSFAEHHIQGFWDLSMPEYAVKSGDVYTINPEFVKWWHTNGSAVPFKIRP